MIAKNAHGMSSFAGRQAATFLTGLRFQFPALLLSPLPSCLRYWPPAGISAMRLGVSAAFAGGAASASPPLPHRDGALPTNRTDPRAPTNPNRLRTPFPPFSSVEHEFFKLGALNTSTCKVSPLVLS